MALTKRPLYTLYSPKVTAAKGGGAAGTVVGAGALVYAVLYVVRANTSLTLWPEALDEAIVVALIAALAGAWRAFTNWRKNRYV